MKKQKHLLLQVLFLVPMEITDLKTHLLNWTFNGITHGFNQENCNFFWFSVIPPEPNRTVTHVTDRLLREKEYLAIGSGAFLLRCFLQHANTNYNDTSYICKMCELYWLKWKIRGTALDLLESIEKLDYLWYNNSAILQNWTFSILSKTNRLIFCNAIMRITLWGS